MGSYFIRIEDATDLRRKVLESSKASINVLRGYQRLAQLRSEKETMLKALRRDLKELTILINRVEEQLPTLSQGEVEELNPPAQELPELDAKKGKQQAKKPAARPQPRRLELPAPGGRQVYLGRPDAVVVSHGTMAPPAPRAPAVAPMAPAQASISEPAAPRTELEKLHDKLAEIESKLVRL